MEDNSLQYTYTLMSACRQQLVTGQAITFAQGQTVEVHLSSTAFILFECSNQRLDWDSLEEALVALLVQLLGGRLSDGIISLQAAHTVASASSALEEILLKLGIFYGDAGEHCDLGQVAARNSADNEASGTAIGSSSAPGLCGNVVGASSVLERTPIEILAKTNGKLPSYCKVSY